MKSEERQCVSLSVESLRFISFTLVSKRTSPHLLSKRKVRLSFSNDASPSPSGDVDGKEFLFPSPSLEEEGEAFSFK
jgi:hypothetical protein